MTYQQFFHACIPFLQVDALDSTFLIARLAVGRMDLCCCSNTLIESHKMNTFSYLFLM